jgi:hypothetical protein
MMSNANQNLFQTKEFDDHFNGLWSPFKKQHKGLSAKKSSKYFYMLGLATYERMKEAEAKRQEEANGSKPSIEPEV